MRNINRGGLNLWNTSGTSRSRAFWPNVLSEGRQEEEEEEKAGVTDMFFFADCISSLKTGQGRNK